MTTAFGISFVHPVSLVQIYLDKSPLS